MNGIDIFGCTRKKKLTNKDRPGKYNKLVKANATFEELMNMAIKRN